MTKLLPLIVLVASLLGPARARAQEPDRDRTRPALTFTAAELLGPPRSVPRLGLAPLPLSLAVPIPAWSVEADPRRWGLPRPTGWLARARPRPTLGPPVMAVTEPAPADVDTAEGVGLFPDLELPDVVQQMTDLGLRVEGRSELGGVWNRYRPCRPGLRLNCNPDLFPKIQPEIQFGIQVGGTITDRITVDVDYDQRREFDAANNINVYYQGEPGELLQRMEMGDVSIDLPASRYLARGIPAGNFGFKAAARLGQLDVEAVWAQQKGDIATREFRLGGAGRSGLVQDQELVLDDADYVTGQFFFLVDPAELDGWPHVDVLELDRGAAPTAVQPRADRLVLYRDEGVSASRYADQVQTGRFLADAVSDDGTRRHSGLFTLLEPGQDYYIHSSGLWVALRAPLRDDEALAIAYETESGVVVGDPDAEATPPGSTPELRLVRGPVTIHQPGQPTWEWEMHQIYRLDSSAEVEASTLDLVISLGHEAGGATFEEFSGGRLPLLRLFGLDDDAPVDRLDVAHVFRPGAELEAVGAPALRGTFIVFPTLEPFGRPPPVPSEGLTAPQTAAILGGNANPAIYNEVDPVVREGSSRYRLNFEYQVQLEGLLNSFNLGAFGIRQGSERITVDDRRLVRGVDYVIDYDLGLVTLLDPEATLGANPEAEIRATWEQRSLFQVAPTTVVGLNAETPVSGYGRLNFVGLYQSEQSIVRRPQLGMAPGAALLGGVTGDLAFQADWVSRALDAIPLLAVDSVTRLDVTGELAASAPNPNRAGATYLDDFEATDEIPLSLESFEWKLGSAPRDMTGVSLPMDPLTTDNAVQLVWQDTYLEDGQEVGPRTPQEIDEQIAFAGARLAERVLYLSLGGAGRSPTTPQWRSMTTVLSTAGRDLSRSEFLEFYAAPLAGSAGDLQLVIDIGTVDEDAFYFNRNGARSGVDEEFNRPWGEGVLDEEARLAFREVWGPEDDRQGLWDQECEADRLNPVPLGDPRANCTVLNGRPDTEDLNANGVLDGEGPLHRYVVPLGPDSPYLVRDSDATSTPFRLFRIPLRGPGAIPLNGASDASWRFVKHLRVTALKPSTGEATLALARVRITGSRWTKRDIDGVMAGLTGEVSGTGAATANVRVGSVSRLTDGQAYASPPGVGDQLQDPSAALGASGVEFNEKSLRVSWDALPGDERAEVYFRYPQQPRSFLEYRQIRFWALAPGNDWDDDHRLLLKLGTDARNYYVYRTPLAAAGNEVVAEDWLPEHVIDFGEWFALKAEAEQRLAENGGGPLSVWSADSTYGLVLEDRAQAPNLSAVRELTMAVYNGGTLESEGEVWIDDLRLDAGARDAGLAGRVDVDLDAGGVVDAAVSYSGEGGRFGQLGDAPTYQTVDELSVNTTTQLGRFAPESWGVAMPMTVSYQRTRHDPFFLPGTDIRADQLQGLRETGSSRRRVGVALRKTTPSSNPVVSALVDGTAVRVGYTGLTDNTVTTTSRLSGVDGGVEVDRAVANVDVGVVPDFVERLLRWLAPRRLEESAFFERLTGTRLRLTPQRIGFSATYVQQDARVWRYARVLESAADAGVEPIESPRRTLEGGARIALRPVGPLTARIGVVSGRDVLAPDRATPLALEQQALRDARTEIAGIPIGWERSRVLTSEAAYRPRVADWLRPSVGWSSRYGLRRNPSHIAVVGTTEGDEARLLRTFNTDRRLTRALVMDVPGAIRAATGAPDEAPGGGAGPGGGGPTDDVGLVGRVGLAVLGPVKPFELSWTDQVGSRFERDRADPGLDYQLGVGTLTSVRYQDGDTAAVALRRDAFRARSGIRIGSSASVDAGYSESDVRVFDLRVGRRTEFEKSWPRVQLSWDEVPFPTVLEPLLSRWSVSTGYIRTRRSTRLDGQVVRIQSQTEVTVPLEIRLGFPGGLSLAYIGAITEGDGRDPTGYTDQEMLSHSVDVSGRVRLPGGLGARFPAPVRVSLTYDYEEQRQTRVPTARLGAVPATPFIDHLNRRVYLSASTLMSRMDIGLQISYLDRRNFIGTQVGSSQFTLGVFGQFNLEAGREIGR
ncbi:MAG: cell surface protein SprA [Longimicrobiales bacterium]